MDYADSTIYEQISRVCKGSKQTVIKDSWHDLEEARIDRIQQAAIGVGKR